jgi:hypothetical protein
MRKLVLLLLIGFMAVTAAFADHPDTLGIGGIFGGGYAFNSNNNYGFGTVGFSLKIPGLPFYWGLYSNFNKYTTGVGITGDYYIFDRNLIGSGEADEAVSEDGSEDSSKKGSYKLKLDWYLGAGLFSDLHFWDGGFAFDVGARVPVGLSWHIIRPLELFLGVGPAFGIYTGRQIPLRFHFFAFGELGLRYWF